MINRKYLPSKNFLIALSIAIVIIVITIIFNYAKPNAAKYNSLVATNASSTSVLDIDSDGDGLPDWKEALYGTDPHKADTDGDGTNDAEEIALGRDPLKPNTAPKGQEPNDKVDASILAENVKKIEEYQRLSDLDRISQDLVSNIIAAQPVKGSIDSNTAQTIISTAINEIPKTQYNGITKASDLNLLPTDETNLAKNSDDYTKSYFGVTEILRTIIGKDIQYINLYVQNNESGTSTKQKILDYAAKYQSVTNALIKMPVPLAVGYYDINYHLTVINDLEKIIAIDKNIVNDDIIGIYSDLYNYHIIMKDLITNLGIIDGILKIKR
jgi:hypothetical protein